MSSIHTSDFISTSEYYYSSDDESEEDRPKITEGCLVFSSIATMVGPAFFTITLLTCQYDDTCSNVAQIAQLASGIAWTILVPTVAYLYRDKLVCDVASQSRNSGGDSSTTMNTVIMASVASTL